MLRFRRVFCWVSGHTDRIGGGPPPMHLEHTDILEQSEDGVTWGPIPIVEDPIPENPRERENREREAEWAARMDQFWKENGFPRKKTES